MKRPTPEAESARPHKAPLASHYGAIGSAALQAALLFARKGKAKPGKPATQTA